MSALPRDVFIDCVYRAALEDPNIIFISADFGAKALDQFRENIPDQFVHIGISEQNMIDFAAGLSQNGKNVFVYAMAPFVTLRCFEQIKVTLASMKLPVTILGVGAGYSYDDAGPTHYATEDLSSMRSLGGIEIFSPSDTSAVEYAAKLCVEKPKLRYVRLDRKHLPDIYSGSSDEALTKGIGCVRKGKEIAVLSNGYMIPKVIESTAFMEVSPSIYDVFQMKPMSANSFQESLKDYDVLVTVEEHFLTGGLGSAVAELVSDNRLNKPLLRIGIEDEYILNNGGRDHIHELAKIDPQSIANKIKRYVS